MLNKTQRREKEVAVYEAVLALLRRGSNLSTLTVSQIAAAAGMGKGTLYEYFSSKDEIVEGLIFYCVDNEIDRLETALAPCHTLRQAEQAIRTYLEELTGQRIACYQIIAPVVMQTAQRFGGLAPEDVLQRLHDLADGLHGRLRRAGEISPEVDPAYFRHVLAASWVPCAVALSPCSWLRTRPDPEPVFANSCRMLEAALG